MAIGGTDAGLDAYYHDRDKKALYMYAFRWTDDHMSFRVALEKLGKNGINKIFFDPSKSADDHPMILSLKSSLFQNWKTIERVIIDFVFNGDPVDAEQSKVLSLLREAVEDKRGFIESYLSRVGSSNIYDLIFNYVSNEKALGRATSSRKTAEYLIDFDGSLNISSKTDSSSAKEMTVTFLSLENLYRMYNDMGERFFEMNLRSGLDEGKMTNIQIKNSLRRILEGKEEPENFTLYHNGITLTSQILEHVDSGGRSAIRMVEPRVLNGAQTVKTLKQFVEEEMFGEKGLGDRANGAPLALQLQKTLAETKTLAKIIRSQDQDFLKRVTINNNRQNPIMPWNLRANDLIQVSFEELFAKLGIYYERRENAYRNLIEEDIDGADADNGVIDIRKFAQTLLAAQGQLDRISEIKEVFENEAWYSDVFREQYLQIDPRKLVLLYKIQFRLSSAIREIRNIGAEKYGYVSKAKNLLWCLCLQALMNDSKFDKYVESYGSSTAVEAGITEFVKSAATTRLRFILSDAFEDKDYQALISDGRFSFLNSKTALTDCMKAAESRFSWQKKFL